MINKECQECGKSFKALKNSRKFCNQSCGASFNNRRFPKRVNVNRVENCLRCGISIKSPRLKYCSFLCNSLSKKEERIQNWLVGNESGSDSIGVLKPFVRNYLLEQADHKCTQCGWCTPNPVTGKPILCVDHVDGNWKNNSVDNLKVLCYNCHTLTPTFGALNRNGLSKDRPGTNRKVI